jgi:plasmid stabilization system protein ParE
MSRYVLTPEAREIYTRFETTYCRKAVLQGPATLWVQLQPLVALLLERRAKVTGARILPTVTSFASGSYSSYAIIYRIDRRPLTVIAILHGRRDLKPVLMNR